MNVNASNLHCLDVQNKKTEVGMNVLREQSCLVSSVLLSNA